MSNSFGTQTKFQGKTIFSLPTLEKKFPSVAKLPYSMKILLENLLRYEDDVSVSKDDIIAFAEWTRKKTSDREIAFRPARVLMQDFTGVPAVVDLAAMRDAMTHLGGDPKRINPLVPVDLVIDHSVMVDAYANATSLQKNIDLTRDLGYVKGAIDIKEGKETKTEVRKPIMSAGSVGSGSSSLGSGTTTYSASASGQGSFLEHK